MSRAPLVLIVSEHEWASRSLESILAPRGYAVLRAYNGRQALERASGSNADAVFIDYRLPDMTGAMLCRILLDRDLVARSAPILLVTSGAATREDRIAALTAGAWELISQPVDAEELLLRMDRFIRAKLEVDRAAEEALIDDATGLYSWHGVARRIQELAAAAERFGRPLACVVFAPGEDEPGEDIEERGFLTATAARLRDATRRSDVLGRIGPREFAIIAPDTSPEGARILADRLRAGGGGGNGRGRPARAGVCAIADLRAAGIDPLELIVQATLASRADPSDQVH
ncbi:MAG TPA: response regulator [Gemmatimonadota bacterium]|nr:response regulator [Gemmatimonadota bacterium]